MMGSRNEEPSADTLLDAFELFDQEGLGRISETHFKKIMRSKTGDGEELEEMIAAYRKGLFLHI